MYKKWLIIGYTLAFLVVGITVVNLGLYFLTGNGFRVHIGWEDFSTIFMTQQVIAFSFSVIAFTIAYNEINRYKKMIENNFSDLSLLQIKWINLFVYLMLFASILWGLELLRIAFGYRGHLSEIVMINWAFLFITILIISYKTFSAQDIFIDDQFDLVEGKLNANEKPEAQINEITGELMTSIDVFMKDKQVFKKNNLNLHEFSKEMDLSSRKISMAINTFHQTNFSNWVNRYRIEHAKQLLTTQKKLTIEGIGIEAGFKSRSAMYLAFKRIVGKSPGDFKA